MSPKVLTIQEVKDYLKIPLSTVYELTRKKSLRAVKVGKHWRYLESDILEYLKSGNAKTEYSEKRTHARINTESPAVLRCLLPSKVELAIPASVRDLSEGGVLVEVKKDALEEPGVREGAVFKVGDPIEIQLELNDGKNSPDIYCSGRLVHQQVKKDMLMGIKFRNLSGKDQEAIRNYVG